MRPAPEHPSPGLMTQSDNGWGCFRSNPWCAITQTAERARPEWGWKTSAATLFGPPRIALAQPDAARRCLRELATRDSVRLAETLSAWHVSPAWTI